jgi:L,D-peptidoglycan transpeptidase YkuD (ErfK/YbiS/YcfS/YnhG family)
VGRSGARRSVGEGGERRNGPIRWLPGVLVALSCVVALSAAPPAARAAHRDAAPQATSLSLSATPPLIDYGGSTTLAGQLSTASGPVAGATLELTSSTDGTTWSQPTGVTTDSAGQFSAQVTPDEAHSRTLYRVAFEGSADLAPAEAQIAIDSRPDLATPAIPLSVGRTSAFQVGGALEPQQGAGHPPVALVCYRLEKGHWVLHQTVATTVADQTSASRYEAGLSLSLPGTWRLRAVYGEGTLAETWSAWSTTMTVTAGPDAPIWDRDGVTTIPERMASRLNARQLIVVTAPRLGSRDGMLRLFDYRDGDWVRKLAVRTRLGSRGLIDGLVRRAGSRTTPTGIWRLPGFVFGKHRRPPAGLRMAYRRITPRSWWSSERNATYNTWVETARAIDGERLADAPVQYEFAFSSGYNARPNPRVYGRGTAIFVHIFDPGYTQGCVSVSRADMVRLLRLLDHARRPACAIGTMRSGTRSCIFAY